MPDAKGNAGEESGHLSRFGKIARGQDERP
jgi:hypothetical protein